MFRPVCEIHYRLDLLIAKFVWCINICMFEKKKVSINIKFKTETIYGGRVECIGY